MAENSSLQNHARKWLVAVLILGVAGAGAGYLIWESVSGVAGVSDEGGRYEGPGFAVLLPGTPVEESTSNESEWGDVQVQRLLVESAGEGTSYLLDYYQYPVGPLETISMFSGQQTAKLVVAAGRQLATELEAEVLSETRLSLDGYPGNEVTIDGPDGLTTTARIYLVKRRLYRLIVTTASAEASRKEIGEFFDSFELRGASAS